MMVPTDETIRIINSFFSEEGFTSYEIIQGPKQGVCRNFLTSLKYNRSDFLCLSDQDDIWTDNKIELISSIAIKKEKDTPLLIFSDAMLIDENNRLFEESFINYQKLNVQAIKDDSILFYNCIQGATICMNQALVDYTSFSLAYEHIVMHDWWLGLIAKYFGEIVFINEPLIQYRQHSENQIGAITKRTLLFHKLKKPLFHYQRAKNLVEQFKELLLFCSNNPNGKNRLLVSYQNQETLEGKMNVFKKFKLQSLSLTRIIIIKILIFL